MEIIFLYKGLVLGFSVAAPVGPIGILCINRTLNKGFTSGLLTGFGAASADLLYGFIAGFGLTAVSNLLLNYKIWIQSLGIIFLFYLGIKTIFKRSNLKFVKQSTNSLASDYFTTFFLTIANPATILFFLAVFAGLGLVNSMGNYFSSVLLVFGVFTGSGLWWVILTGITNKLKRKIGQRILDLINVLSGIIIILFGIVISVNLVT